MNWTRHAAAAAAAAAAAKAKNLARPAAIMSACSTAMWPSCDQKCAQMHGQSPWLRRCKCCLLRARQWTPGSTTHRYCPCVADDWLCWPAACAPASRAWVAAAPESWRASAETGQLCRRHGRVPSWRQPSPALRSHHHGEIQDPAAARYCSRTWPRPSLIRAAATGAESRVQKSQPTALHLTTAAQTLRLPVFFCFFFSSGAVPGRAGSGGGTALGTGGGIMGWCICIGIGCCIGIGIGVGIGIGIAAFKLILGGSDILDVLLTALGHLIAFVIHRLVLFALGHLTRVLLFLHRFGGHVWHKARGRWIEGACNASCRVCGCVATRWHLAS
eukprot:m.243897 g.243897  ORF g.243897 m.243897 type:complete len:330 (+) comp10951_c3_seq13:696-1685(+)